MPLDAARIRAAFPQREVVWLETAGSTMIEAARLAAENCPSGSIVGAEQQLSGQGRHGRTWHSEREAGIYVSTVLRLPLPVDSLPVLTLALGLAVQDAIARSTGLACDLRWPNDLLLEGRKCSGILTQLNEGAVIAGIGINVNQARFPSEIAGIATSLRIVSSRIFSREEILFALLESVDAFGKILLEEGKEQILRLYCRGSSYVQGRRVIVEQEHSILEGTTNGLDPSGFLKLRKDDGTQTLILAGGVRPA